METLGNQPLHETMTTTEKVSYLQTAVAISVGMQGAAESYVAIVDALPPDVQPIIQELILAEANETESLEQVVDQYVSSDPILSALIERDDKQNIVLSENGNKLVSDILDGLWDDALYEELVLSVVRNVSQAHQTNAWYSLDY